MIEVNFLPPTSHRKPWIQAGFWILIFIVLASYEILSNQPHEADPRETVITQEPFLQIPADELVRLLYPLDHAISQSEDIANITLDHFHLTVFTRAKQVSWIRNLTHLKITLQKSGEFQKITIICPSKPTTAFVPSKNFSKKIVAIGSHYGLKVTVHSESDFSFTAYGPLKQTLKFFIRLLKQNPPFPLKSFHCSAEFCSFGM